MKDIYLLSGLGADKRVYQKIDFGQNNINHINWIKPLHDESIESYALRLTQQIKSHNPVLIGVSFGGMLAIEIAKLIKVNLVIIVSSVKSKAEIPTSYKLLGKLKFNKILPKKILNKPNPILNYLFGVNTDIDKEALRQIIKESDPDFINWGIDKIVNWKNTVVLNNIVHIHGTSDKILPYRKLKNVTPVKFGGHLMLLNKSDTLSNIIKQNL